MGINSFERRGDLIDRPIKIYHGWLWHDQYLKVKKFVSAHKGVTFIDFVRSAIDNFLDHKPDWILRRIEKDKKGD